MNIHQSRMGTRTLTALVVALGVSLGAVGCSERPTPSGTISTSAARALVDVEAVWATHPLPPCPRVIVGNQPAPAGLELPSDETVARQLAGVRSPGSESWVREKLGWVSMWLAKVRADIISDPGVGAREQDQGFNDYVNHVRAELQAAKDISSELDSIFPEGCA
ncbi:Uncharacterised protein [Mycobacteroides abscessus subsp. abscessus]|nr:Uncharacterised protein [Mycobacteroides abscessus subsp. abscessus]SLI67006.1 Uncharacterised protein [Mycobacteroides abscessus subsp. abscessus]